jgi:hypothetical protein
VQVSGSLAVHFSDEFEERVGDIDGDGGSVLSALIHFKAPGKPSESPEDLVRVALHDWNANLDRILNDQTDPVGAVNDVFHAEVGAS